MITQQILIGNIPSILWGNDSSRLYLYVHGQGGNKEEASFLAEKICVKGWQVLSFDLPGHGERKDEHERFENCLFVSPVLDMKQLILKMMSWANVTEEQLCREKIIPTSFGQTLTWEYWQYAVNHPILKWDSPTRILYGEHDHMIDYRVAENFSKKFHCTMTVISNNFQNRRVSRLER